MNTQYLLTWLLGGVLGAILFASCQPKQKKLQIDETPSQQTSLEHTAYIKYAKGFKVESKGGYKVVTILPFQESDVVSTYLLLPKGEKIPTDLPSGAIPIQVPVQRMVVMSSMHVGMLDLLGATSVIKGVDQLNYIYSLQIHQAAKEHAVMQVGQNMDPNVEKIIQIQPDLVMGTGNTGPSPLQRVSEAGIPVLLNSEWMEESPLAKAEWLKLMGLFVGKEQEATQAFSEIEQEYQRLTALVKPIQSRPTILTGINLKDVWYMPNRDNYMTQFLLDAGANYPLQNREGRGSSALTFESVYPMALEATVWLNLGGVNVHSKEELLALDQRFADFKAFQLGEVYDYTKRINEVGANDFWESAGIRPDIVLADLIKILHPEVLPNHQLYYYKRL